MDSGSGGGLLTPEQVLRLSKLMTFLLRHQPARFGLTLDAEGFVPLEDLVTAIRPRYPAVTKADILQVVATDDADKQRFSVRGQEIRANYGHSTANRIRHVEGTPPESLYHGTTANSLGHIRRHGLLPMGRQYVHLTADLDLALRIGARHGEACLVRVDAARAHADGFPFYVASRGLWLVERLPPHYLHEEIASTG